MASLKLFKAFEADKPEGKVFGASNPRREVKEIIKSPHLLLTGQKNEKAYQIKDKEKGTERTVRSSRYPMVYVDSENEPLESGRRLRFNLPKGVVMSGIQIKKIERKKKPEDEEKKKQQEDDNEKKKQEENSKPEYYYTYGVSLRFDMDNKKHAAFFEQYMSFFGYWAQTYVHDHLDELYFTNQFIPEYWHTNDHLRPPFSYKKDKKTGKILSNPSMWVDLRSIKIKDGRMWETDLSLPNPEYKKKTKGLTKKEIKELGISSTMPIDWQTIEGLNKWNIDVLDACIELNEAKASSSGKVSWNHVLDSAILGKIEQNKIVDEELQERAAEIIDNDAEMVDWWSKQAAFFARTESKSNQVEVPVLPANVDDVKPEKPKLPADFYPDIGTNKTEAVSEAKTAPTPDKTDQSVKEVAATAPAVQEEEEHPEVDNVRSPKIDETVEDFDIGDDLGDLILE